MMYALALALMVLLGAPALADDPIPVGVPSAPPATPPATPAGGGQWQVSRTAVGEVVDALANQMFGTFERFTTAAIALAQTLFVSLAGLEFGWTMLRWALSSMPLEEMVADSYVKLVQLTLLYGLIGMTFQSPWGPGWFQMIVNGIAGMGQTTAGLDIVQLASSGQFTPVLTPGTIVDLGFSIFTQIMTGAAAGVNGWTLVQGLTSGSTLLFFGVWLFALVSACGIVLLLAYVAFRFFLVLMKAYLIGAQAFLTGFLGSRVTASMGLAVFNLAFNVGIEMAVLVVVIGTFAPVIANFTASMGFAQALGGTPGTSALAAPVIQVGALVSLDVGIVLWTYAVKRAPDIAQMALSGAITLYDREFTAHARATSGVFGGATAPVRMLAGGAGGVVGGSGGAPSASDRVAGAAAGALRGGLLAGPEGAWGGALVGAFTAKGRATADRSSAASDAGRPFSGGFTTGVDAPGDGAEDVRDRGAAGGAERAESAGAASTSSTNAAAGESAREPRDGSGGGAGGPGAGGLGALLGAGSPTNPVNMLLYRALLAGARPKAPPIDNVRPAVSLGVTHVE